MILGRNRKVEIKIIEIDALCLCVFWGEGKKSRWWKPRIQLTYWDYWSDLSGGAVGTKTLKWWRACGRYLVFWVLKCETIECGRLKPEAFQTVFWVCHSVHHFFLVCMPRQRKALGNGTISCELREERPFPDQNQSILRIGRAPRAWGFCPCHSFNEMLFVNYHRKFPFLLHFGDQ